MGPSQTAEAPARAEPVKPRKPPTPKRLQKKVLTLAQAAEQWERTDDKLAELGEKVKTLEAEHAEAEEILLAHFVKTGSSDYKKRLGHEWTKTRLILDQAKVTKFLGEQLKKYQKRTESKHRVTRLTAPE
jgi:hemerythrin superfamily protein